VKAVHETQDWRGEIYNAAQVALRSVVGAVAVEALLLLVVVLRLLRARQS